ncbi:hypothetical protein ALI44B_01075 [Leifsonia sp. ALI-44-B]|nr:hypothetical protein ALI44B_01075 [Leifsonia sp. ALI-44-B]
MSSGAVFGPPEPLAFPAVCPHASLVGILAQTSDAEDGLFFREAAGLAVSFEEVCSGVEI